MHILPGFYADGLTWSYSSLQVTFNKESSPTANTLNLGLFFFNFKVFSDIRPWKTILFHALMKLKIPPGELPARDVKGE